MAVFGVRAPLGWAWYWCEGQNCCPKECTVCRDCVRDGLGNRLPMEPLQHLRPQPHVSSRSHPSSVVCGGAELWEAVGQWSVSLLVCCASPLGVHVWPCTTGGARSPARLCLGSAPASGGTWMRHVQPSPSCLWPSLVFWGQHGGTGNDDVLFTSQFHPLSRLPEQATWWKTRMGSAWVQ